MTAFITGGGSGVGFGMAKAFCGAGMNVVIADVRQDHLDQAMGSLKGMKVRALRLDVTDRGAMARAADETAAEWSRTIIVQAPVGRTRRCRRRVGDE
jgi:NAD(P)-dependent dehydrogenase (short-subunit alcohol dehydrogenase family)